MNIEKKNVNIFLALWIKHDPEIWSELRDIQIQFLLDRIVKEMTFKEMAAKHKIAEGRMRQLFESLLIRIERNISHEAAYHLRFINKRLDERPDKPFTVVEIYLN